MAKTPLSQEKITIDAIHSVKQIREKAQWYKTVLKELGKQSILVWLIHMTIKRRPAGIKHWRRNSRVWKNQHGLSLSATLFTLALEYVLWKMNKRTLTSSGGEIVTYADDIVK